MVMMTEELDEAHTSLRALSVNIILLYKFQACRRRRSLERRKKHKGINARDKQAETQVEQVRKTRQNIGNGSKSTD